MPPRRPTTPAPEKTRHTARLGALEDLLFEAFRAIGRNIWNIGTWLEEIATQKLYVVRGHGTFNDYVLQTLHVDDSTAYAYRQIARFPREVAEQVPAGHLEIALAYYELTPQTELLAEVLADRFPIEVDGAIVPTPLADCSQRQLQGMMRRLRQGRTVQVLPEDVQRFLDIVESGMEPTDSFRLAAAREGDTVGVDTHFTIAEAWRFHAALGRGLGALVRAAWETEGAASERLVSPSPPVPATPDGPPRLSPTPPPAAPGAAPPTEPPLRTPGLRTGETYAFRHPRVGLGAPGPPARPTARTVRPIARRRTR